MDNVIIIADIGINHNGRLENAFKLIDMAVECGADAVKFQKRDIETVYTREFLDSPRESTFGDTQRAQKEGLEFGRAEYDAIDEYCRREMGIEWFASAWDLKSLEFLDKYNCRYNKVASAMITNIPFLEAVAKRRRHTFISTGMCEMEDINKAFDIFINAGAPFTLLHCVSTYPCDDEDCNIEMINRLRVGFQCPVGYSGHERGITPSLIAIALGAQAVERHITLDRTAYGSDQPASLEKHGLELLVREAKLIKGMMGDGTKVFGDKEKEVAKKLRYWE